MKKILYLLCVVLLTSCATQRGFDYKKHYKNNKKLEKRGYRDCNRST